MPQMGVSVSEGTVTRWLEDVGDTIAGRRDAARDLDRQGRHRGAEPRLRRAAGDPRPGGRDGAGRDDRRSDRPARPARRPPDRACRSRCRSSRSAPEPEPEADRRARRPDGRARAGRREPEPVAASPSPLRRRLRRPERTQRRRPHSFVSPVVARIAAEHGIDPSDDRRARAAAGASPRRTSCLRRGSALPAPSRPRRRRLRQLPYRPRRRPRSCSAACAVRTSGCAGSRPAAVPQPTAPSRGSRSRPAVESGESLEPMSAMRRGIAEHMRRSLDTAAHVTSAIEVDMSKVVAIRERLKAEYKSALRRQPHLPRLRLARNRRDAQRLAVGQRGDPRRVGPDPELRQPRLRGRARRAARA